MLMIFSHRVRAHDAGIPARCGLLGRDGEPGRIRTIAAAVTVTSYLMGGSVMPDTISPISHISPRAVSGPPRRSLVRLADRMTYSYLCWSGGGRSGWCGGVCRSVRGGCCVQVTAWFQVSAAWGLVRPRSCSGSRQGSRWLMRSCAARFGIRCRCRIPMTVLRMAALAWCTRLARLASSLKQTSQT